MYPPRQHIRIWILPVRHLLDPLVRPNYLPLVIYRQVPPIPELATPPARLLVHGPLPRASGPLPGSPDILVAFPVEVVSSAVVRLKIEHRVPTGVQPDYVALLCHGCVTACAPGAARSALAGEEVVSGVAVWVSGAAGCSGVVLAVDLGRAGGKGTFWRGGDRVGAAPEEVGIVAIDGGDVAVLVVDGVGTCIAG